MKKLISLFLCIVMAFSSLYLLVSCGQPDGPGSEENESSDNDNSKENGGTEQTAPGSVTLRVPEYKDYGRGTLNFAEISYSRPKTDEIVEKFNTATALVEKNELSYEEQLKAVEALEEDFSHFLTMYSYADIMLNKNTADPYWVEEHTATRRDYPAFSKAVEDLFVAAAKSTHAENFEKDYFGENLIEEYADGGDYTDALVALMETEAELESEYTALSTSNVKITYNDITDTPHNILKAIEEDHGINSTQYSIAKKECARLYEEAYAKRTREIYIELLKIRKDIASEHEAQSYRDVAYDEIYHDYSKEDFIKFADDISKYIVPVYARLSHFVFTPYFYGHSTQSLEPNTVINDLYDIYEDLDPDLFEAYSFMLQHGLFDCSESKDNRYAGAFCTYLESYNAPFLFATLDSGAEDYTTISHEFGHFFDGYVNYGDSTSLDLSEVSSTALEFLTLSALSDKLSADDYKYLLYTKLNDTMEAMIFQGFYALFEHYAYELDYADITEEKLLTLMQSAADKMGLDLSRETTFDAIIIPHTVLYPFYVQSYCTSSAVALDIYYTELLKEGEGLLAYKELVLREDGDEKFEKQLEDAMLSSPFENKFLRELADKIHYQVLGSHFYKPENDKGESAA